MCACVLESPFALTEERRKPGDVTAQQSPQRGKILVVGSVNKMSDYDRKMPFVSGFQQTADISLYFLSMSMIVP